MSKLDFRLPPSRRIVTSNVDVEGAIAKCVEPAVAVIFDDEPQEVRFPSDLQISHSKVWAQPSVPYSNTGNEDGALKDVKGDGLVLQNGISVRFNDIGLGVFIPMHRTTSTDYVIWLSGSMELITPSATWDPKVDVSGPKSYTRTPVPNGSVVVQRGTLHGWLNTSKDQPGRSVSVIVDAEKFEKEGKKLDDAFFMQTMGLFERGF